MEIQELRDKVFSWFQTKVNNEPTIKTNQRLIAIDKQYERQLDTMSLESKRDLILDCEYNYIQQASMNDLTTLYKIN